VNIAQYNDSPTMGTKTQLRNAVASSQSWATSITALTEQSLTIVPSAEVASRQVFYHRSTSTVFGDGSGNPINSIDPTKTALLPGQTASTAHYTNYSRGLNGIVLDLVGTTFLPGISPASFRFASWSNFSNTTPAFVAIYPSVTVSTFAGGGTNGSDRLKLEFPNNAIQNAWLRVTVLANSSTGLVTNDVFYFGNARLDVTPTSPFPTQQVTINIFDTNAIRAKQGQNPGIISNIFDVDRNGVVNIFDTNAVRVSQGVNSLRSFTAPGMQSMAAFAISFPVGAIRGSSRQDAESTDAYFGDFGSESFTKRSKRLGAIRSS
jgi:hypothetical protein